MELKDAVKIAQNGTHCGMCRIDFLNTGLCPSGKKHGFLAYWPQGRMEIVKALEAKKIKPTEKLKEIVSSCPLCGICDKQCNWTTGLRPEKVAQALKDYVESLNNTDFKKITPDEVTKDLQKIVGEQWATNDPAIITAYVRSIIPMDAELNYYVVMPETTEQVSEIIKYANTHNIPFLPRSGGTSMSVVSATILAKGLSLERGIIIDVNRMKTLEIHPETCTATVGAGITSFELQKAAESHQLRASVAEAGAHYCANITTTGVISTWQNKYGCFADNFINATIVDNSGEIKHHDDLDATNPYVTEYGFTNISLTPFGVTTELEVKLHPIHEDEEAIIIPFENLDDATEMLLKLGKRDVGQSLAVISRKYLAEFLSPTIDIAKDFAYICKNYLKLNYAITAICNHDDKKIIQNMSDFSLDQEFMEQLILGAPNFTALKESEFLKILADEPEPLKSIVTGPMRPHLDKVLDASPETIAKVYDKDLQSFFIKAYAKPHHLTDLIWLHAYRIFPSRLMRQQMFLGPGGAIWAATKDDVINWIDLHHQIGEKYQLTHELGFISPMDHGKFVYMEYDYFFNHNNKDESKRASDTIIEATERSLAMGNTFTIINYLFKGLHRKEHVLYPLLAPLDEEEQLLFKEILKQILGDY